MDEASVVNIDSEGLGSKIKSLVKNPVFVVVSILGIISVSASAYIILNITSSRNQNNSTVNLALPANQPTSAPSQSMPTVTLVPQVSLSPTLTPPVAPSNGWQTFQSAISRYSVSYPPNWIAQSISSSDPLILDYAVFNPTSTSAGVRTITISYTTRTTTQLNQIYGTNGTPLTISNAAATEYDQQDSDGNQTVSVILTKNAKTFIFFSLSGFKSILLQMLPTFSV